MLLLFVFFFNFSKEVTRKPICASISTMAKKKNSGFSHKQHYNFIQFTHFVIFLSIRSMFDRGAGDSKIH